MGISRFRVFIIREEKLPICLRGKLVESPLYLCDICVLYIMMCNVKYYIIINITHLFVFVKRLKSNYYNDNIVIYEK